MMSADRFIVGMSRAGTTWVGKCLNEHPHVAVFGESLFWGRAYVEPDAKSGTYSAEQVRQILQSIKQNACDAFMGEGAGNLKHISSDNWPGVVDELSRELSPTPTPVEIFNALSGKIVAFEGKRLSIEKTPHHVNWIERISQSLPGSRFVIMMRDPYAFMLSYKHQGRRYESALRNKFKRLYHPITCAFLWRAYFRSIVAANALYPEQTLVVVTEKMKQASELTMIRIQAFFSLEAVSGLSACVPPDNSSFDQNERPVLSCEDVFWMNCIAGEDIKGAGKLFGFEFRSTPLNHWRVILSILSFPMWMIWATIHLRDSTESSVWQYLMSWMRRFL